MLQRKEDDFEYNPDICRVTNGAHIREVHAERELFLYVCYFIVLVSLFKQISQLIKLGERCVRWLPGKLSILNASLTMIWGSDK